MTSLFERLGKERTAPPNKKAHQLESAQKLLDWLQRWNKNTVTLRNILQFGPHSTRYKTAASNAADVLVKNGWLIPMKTQHKNREEWYIVRQLRVYPAVATESIEKAYNSPK
jgi:hypothetical protein